MRRILRYSYAAEEGPTEGTEDLEHLPWAEGEHDGIELPFLASSHLIVLCTFRVSGSEDTDLNSFSAAVDAPSHSIWQRGYSGEQSKLGILTQLQVSWLILSNYRDGELIIFIFREF